MWTALLSTLLLSYAAADKEYVVDGALKVASLEVLNKSQQLSTASEVFNKDVGLVVVLFQLVLSKGRLVVEEMSRQGSVDYTENSSQASFRFHGLLRSRIDGDYVLYAGGLSMSSGAAVVSWNIGFNATLGTESCDLVIESPPVFESNSFHLDLYSKDKKMNVSYRDYPFNSITSVYQQTLLVLIERAMVKIPICDAIPC